MNAGKKTLLIGASENPARYANMAIRALRSNEHVVFALAKRHGQVDDVEFLTEFPDEDIDTVTLYVGPPRQHEYYQKVIDLKPKRVIFNPGTENPEFYQLLVENGIEPVEACTLVMLSIGNY